MNYTAEQLQENYKTFLSYIDKYITGERKKQLKSLYADHEERVMMMPASGTDHYHNCFVGGYVDHVNRVIDCALEIRTLWEKFGAHINYTEEELVFAAMNHDLGKIGTEDAEQYIPNPSDWHVRNQGKVYINNPANAFMTVPDRGLKILADRGIKVSDNEWFGIKLHDGVYEEANRPYYISWNPDSALRTNLPIVLHQADHMASRIEKEHWMNQKDGKSTPTNTKKAKTASTFKKADKTALLNTFDELFKKD